jgi:hypothetical protein
MTTKQEAHERAAGYAAGREDASGVSTVPAPKHATAKAHRGLDYGWMDFADAFAAAQDDYNEDRRGSMTNCKAAYQRWTESGGRSVTENGTTGRHDQNRS